MLDHVSSRSLNIIYQYSHFFLIPASEVLPGQSRPAALPPADADLVVVEEVDPRGEADALGIRAGDVLRAVSYVGTGPEPGWLDQMLGAEAMPMKKVWMWVSVIWSVAKLNIVWREGFGSS